jgi:hypothetical protein
MSKKYSPLEVYKVLPQSNCGQCQLPSCLAFSAAIIKQQKKLSDCPMLDSNTIAQFDDEIGKHVSIEQTMAQSLDKLKMEVATLDFTSRADKIDASLNDKKLVVKCLGKDFSIDAKGNIASQCHTNVWLTIPLLNYVLFGTGKNISGNWVPLRELENGTTWGPLFGQRCEKPLKQIADKHPEFFEDLVYIFSGKSSENNFLADISVILYPLPKIPILICYWKPEDDLESKLNIFFDTTAEENLNIELIYTLGVGLVIMFEKIMNKHI